MNKTLSKTLVVGGVMLSLCAPVLASATILHADPILVQADQVAPTNTTIEIHKIGRAHV